MVEMYEICEGMFVPKGCCTFGKLQENGGETVVDDDMLPCGGGCDKVCEECVIQEVFNSYAKLSGQAGSAGGQNARRGAYGGGITVGVGMRGHKKILKKIRQMKREAMLLNGELEKAVKLGEALQAGSARGIGKAGPSGSIAHEGAGRGSGDGKDKKKLR